MIDYDYPDLFLGDAVTKDFIITDGEVEVINDDSWAITAEATVAIRNVDLESESFELHQSLNSEMQLRFGSCESAYISFVCHSAWWGDIANLKGKVLNVYIIPNNHATKIIQIGVFKVQENKLTNDRKARKVTAYDAMYDILNSDVAEWYNNVAFMPIPIAPEPSVAMSSFRNFFLAYFGLEAEATTLVNDSIVLHKTINPETLSGADVIKAICEINGVFGQITNEGKFRFVELPKDIREDPDEVVTDLEVAHYIDVEYEDYDSLTITGVKVITNKETKFFASAETPENIYTINGNFLIADYQGANLTTVVQKLAAKLYNHYYQPLTVNALGNPVHEVGDAIKVILKDGTELPTYILERNLRGIQALRDTYTAKGEEEAGESLNSISSRYNQISNEIAQATSQAVVAASSDFVETIRNIGFRLLDEPSDVSCEYDEDNNEVSIKWTDPADIATNEPCPATWAGTVVVRKENSAPLHRWDGTLIVDSTIKDEYSSTPLIDNTLEPTKQFYYGIFPYDTDGHYRFTKVISIVKQPQAFDILAICTTTDLSSSVNYNGVLPPDYYYESNDIIFYGESNRSMPTLTGETFDYTSTTGEHAGTMLNFPLNHKYKIYSVSFKATFIAQRGLSNQYGYVGPRFMNDSFQKVGPVYALWALNDQPELERNIELGVETDFVFNYDVPLEDIVRFEIIWGAGVWEIKNISIMAEVIN